MMLARELLPTWEGWPDTVAEILALVETGKSQAYELLDRLRASLPDLVGRPGRPVSPSGDEKTLEALFAAVRQYIVRHPGAVCDTGERCTYTDGFRRFVIGLQAPGQPGERLSVERLSSVTGVALGTLKDWLYPQTRNSLDADADALEMDSAAQSTEIPEGLLNITNVHVRLVVSLWPSWEGSFQSFCRMLRTEHRFPHGDTFIGSVLHGFRLRTRKTHQPVEAPWSSGTFRALFPGAQWLGDGTSLNMGWDRQTFTFNVQPFLDVASNATVGVTVSDTEDEEAVRLAYAAGLETTAGVFPVATMLDNRPSNHSPEAVAALPGTILLRSTPGRGQSKAGIEGAFGLFQQYMPPLVVFGETPREQAKSVLHLILTAWYRGRNGRPRKSLNGRTPAEAYIRAEPSPEEIQEALAWFAEIQRRQERFQLTRAARLDPVRIELLTKGLLELKIADPDGRLARALAGYAQDAIARGLAVFHAKQELGTVPSDADPGRYLGGIIRQLNIQLELERVSVYLLEQRIRLRDLTLAPLHRAAEKLQSELPLSAVPEAFIDRALNAPSEVDNRFWGKSAAQAMMALPAALREQLYRTLCRQISASFTTDRNRRADLVDRLAQVVASI